MPHHLADTSSEDERNAFQWNSRSDSQCKRRDGKAQSRVEPQTPYKQQKQQHRTGHAGQQIPSVRGRDHSSHAQIIAALSRLNSNIDANLQPFMQIMRRCFNLLAGWLV